ncbi:lipase member H-like isoform X1 [Rhodnius prolixus]|uniref:lipase member H-like isoform X1 n=1 Tax=Rhodnius prolixus TaxID=13249 RepID=UPI003D1896DB
MTTLARPAIGFGLIVFIVSDFSLVSAGFGRLSPSSSTKFYLLSKGEPLTFTKLPQNVTLNPDWLSPTTDTTAGSLEESIPLGLILHGWRGQSNSSLSQELGKALLDSYKSWNLVSADYSLAVNRDYLNAVNEVMPVAKKVAKWLTELINDGHASPEKITLIGFSLGAQVAGIAAQALRSLNFTVGKIVALDPALPSFDAVMDEARLSPDDADHVIVVHTTGGILGVADPVGHIDFYPNGGIDPQPMCTASSYQSMKCSHSASYKYLADAILNGGLEATKCEDWLQYEEGKCIGNPTTFLGINVDRSAVGKYYLKTRREPPYGEKGITTTPEGNLDKPTVIVQLNESTGDSAQLTCNFSYFNFLLIILCFIMR